MSETTSARVPVPPVIMSPDKFFGFKLGSDRRIARWDKVAEYFHHLAAVSDRIVVEELGKSTEGQAFLLVTISSPSNLARIERLRRISLSLSDPRGLAEDEARDLVAEGCAVVCQTMSLHANEIGGTQMSPELAYDLVVGESADTRRVLDNVVFLMAPCFNPDGQIAVTDWYNRFLGTEYEGTGLPWLYHKYAGHDNNRDAVMLNLVESRYVAKLMLRDWMPQVYQDHHHMGGGGIRLYVAPYTEPIRPYADPLVWREIAWYGAHITYLLEEQGRQGVLSGAHWTAWGHLGFHRLTILHNIAGLLTESASAKLATPVFVHPEQLRGTNPKSHPDYAAQTNFPNPWPGGWWRLGDIVGQQKTTAWAVLDLAARFKETVLWSAYLKARRQTEAGAAGRPAAYIIPPSQHDPATARKLVGLLLDQGIEVKVAAEEFESGGRRYPAGTFAIFLAQPKRGVILNLLGRTVYPDNYWTRNPDGGPIVYDLATDTVSEYMGVDVVATDETPGGGAGFRAIRYDDLSPAGRTVTGSSAAAPVGGYAIDGRLNDSFVAVNRLLAAGIPVWRLEGAVKLGDGEVLPPGGFYVETGGQATEVEVALGRALDQLGIEVRAVGRRAAAVEGVMKTPVRPLRIGLYQRFWGGNMDEGWTRYVLERFEFPHCTVTDTDFVSGASLAEKVDVLILPADRPEMIIGPTKAGKPGSGAGGQSQQRAAAMPVPPEYQSGIGAAGVAALAEFVRGGGRLVALDDACALAVDALGLRVRNVIAGVDRRVYSCKGSMLRALVDVGSRWGYGMTGEALVLNVDSPVFEIQETFRAHDYEAVVTYAREDLVQSGWVIGGDRIAGKVAVVAVKAGKGVAVLLGAPVQFRAQTHGTFKLLFNCLV